MERNGDTELLTRTGPDEVATAWGHRQRLVTLAVQLRRAAVGTADRRHPCVLAAHRLAALATGPVGPSPDPFATQLATFRVHLTTALDAVRVCRQTVHPSGGCWFADVPGVDGCAHLLRLAHEHG